MNWVVRTQEAIEYIEENITDDIDINALVKIMYCSKHDCQRIFSYLTDIPLYEYIKRRRLTLAGMEIRSGKEKIIDIAVKYGHESHSSFSRSFKEFHVITPSEARKKPELPLAEYPKFSIYKFMEE